MQTRKRNMSYQKSIRITSTKVLTMKFLCVCLLLVFSSGLGVPTADRRTLQRMAQTLRGRSGGYGIIGSKAADIKKYPYTGSLNDVEYNYLIGGATILNKNWVVCSAYEISSYKPDEVFLRVGSNKTYSRGQKLSVSKIISHEKFDIQYAYDVAVIKVSTPIKLGKTARPIKLAKSLAKAGTKAQITGFGEVWGDSVTEDSLQVGTVEVKSQSDCKKAYPTIGDTCFCTQSDTVGPCIQDMGDPLVNNNELYGWFLGGEYCKWSDDPEIFANAAELRQWVLDTIKKNSNEDEMEGIDDDDFYRSFDEDEDNYDE